MESIVDVFVVACLALACLPLKRNGTCMIRVESGNNARQARTKTSVTDDADNGEK